MKLRLRDILLIGFVSLIGYSCVYETLPTPEVEVPDTVSYVDQIQIIWNESCNSSGCHSAGGPPPNLAEPADNSWTNLVFFDYVDTADAEGSLLYQKIAPGGSMEQFADDQDRALIKAWIEQGALFN